VVLGARRHGEIACGHHRLDRDRRGYGGFPFATVGEVPQDLKFTANTRLVVGARCRIREARR
jgi:acyl-[acyl carrier protein]--UDP-N-acetylglucosamine O-acyltransferase